MSLIKIKINKHKHKSKYLKTKNYNAISNSLKNMNKVKIQNRYYCAMKAGMILKTILIRGHLKDLKK